MGAMGECPKCHKIYFVGSGMFGKNPKETIKESICPDCNERLLLRGLWD